MSAPSPAPNDGLPQDVAFSPGRQRIPKKESSLPNPIPRVSSEFDDGGIVLPPGVTLPPSVTPQVLAGKPKRFLLELPPSAMIEALAEFDQAVQERGSEIRSLPAYLIGVIKRYKTIQQASKGGGGGQLSLRVLDRLDRLVSTGYCTQAEIDEKLKNKLTMLSEEDALGAIDEMNAIQRSEIRQFASYFMGIMNRYAKKRDSNALNNNHHGNDDRQRGRDQNQDYRERRLAGSNDKYSHYGRGSDDQNSMSRYGRDSSRGVGRDRDERRRSRSRSRSRSYDRDRRRRRRSRSRSDSRSRSRSRSRERRRRRRRRSNSRSRSNSRDRDYRSHRSRRDNDRHTSRNSGHSKPGGFSVPPPPPPRPHTNVPPPPNVQQRSVNDQQLQQLFQMPQPTRPPQQSQQISLPANLSQQQIQALQQILRGPNAQQPSALAPQNNTSRWAGQAAAPIPAQAQPWQQRPPQGPGQAWPPPQQVHQPPHPPLDIMGLADKAAQALSGQQFISQHHASANPNVPSVTEAELPPLCKLAVQNLRGSGHINNEPLDSYVCSLLKKIPEANALVSLETFASCDASKMRNKTAYLAGILKKELVKLGIPS